MAPPKPSAQTQFLLQMMEAFAEKEEGRWEPMMVNMDILFSKAAEDRD
jgi:hypothetical protein